ncbi:MAG: autotransporter-associated beta strand repeat-containing protein, partial [Verrucomicrobiota bacterium]
MDIGNNGDAFRFLYQTRNGDGTLTARVTGITPTDPFAKAGVMIRESLDVGARNAMMALSAGNGVVFQQRTASLGASASTVVGPNVAPPYWLRVVRAGNAFTGYVSTDGSSWTQIGTTNIAGFNSTALWGLAVTAHSNTLINVATFDNVQTPTVAYYWDNNGATTGFGAAGGTWAGTTIGDSSHGWSMEPTGGIFPGTVTTATSDDSENFGTDSSGLAAGTITVTNTVNTGSNLVFGAASGAITVSGGTSITLPATATITVNNASDVIGTPLGGASTSLTKAGTGTLTLTGANTYTGETTVSAGTLQIGDGTSGHDGSLLTSGITDSGALVYNLYGNQAAGYAISGTGSLTKNGAGTLALTGPNTYTGATTVSAGTLELGGAGTLGGGTYAGTITNYGAFVHSSSANQTLAAITGSGSITQSGASTLTLTSWGVGNSGTITVNSGTIQMPDGNWNQESHHIVVNGGTFFTSDGNSRALSWTLNGGTVSSRGDASPGFWGNMMLYDNQAVTVGGAAVSTISSHVMLGAGSEFAVGPGSTLNVTGALSNSVWAGGGNGSFIKTGDGTLALSGANNYTGTTTVNAGALHLETAGTVIYTGGTIAINNGSTVKFDGGAGNQYWLDGKTIAFGAGGGTVDTGTGVNIVTGAFPTGGTGLTFTTTAGTTSTISGSSGINTNGNAETFDVASTSTLNLTS